MEKEETCSFVLILPRIHLRKASVTVLCLKGIFLSNTLLGYSTAYPKGSITYRDVPGILSSK